jgi:hypothetical protein
MRLRILIDGRRAFIYDGDTGRSLKCTRISLHARADRSPRLRLEVIDFDAEAFVDLAPRGDIVAEGPGQDQSPEPRPEPGPEDTPLTWATL